MNRMRSAMQAPLQFVKSDAIAENYPAAAITSTADELVGAMQFIEQLFPDRAIIICQRAKHPSVQYAGIHCKKVFGLHPFEIKKMTLPDFLTRVHPDDIGEVNQCFAFINSLEPYDPLVYRFELHYRFQHKNGYYINIIDEKLAMKSAAGKYIYLNLFRDVSSEEKFYDVKMNVYRQTGSDLKKIQTYIPRLNQSDLTPRQKEIVNLISKGFTNSEIARELCVSIHTIKNHKSILFRKVKVRNTLELLGAANTLQRLV